MESSDVLPFDIKLKILYFLDPKSIFTMSCVNKGFLLAAQEEGLWEKLLTLPIAAFTDLEKLRNTLYNQLAVVRFVDSCERFTSGRGVDRSRSVSFVAFTTHRPTSTFVPIAKSDSSSTLATLLAALQPPPNKPSDIFRFVLFTLGDTRVFRLLFWAPNSTFEPIHEFWKIHYETRISKCIPKEERMVASNVREFIEQISGDLPPELKTEAEQFL
eukprot:c39289_g1_i1.p1 GENE.c39289_g1_i1~~c39289_g1_i1.p1  ORF type:complete len:215 (-),score=32.10 c39289_g1_i1:139-783(-)